MIKEIKITEQRVREINENISNVKICTIGDICLDLYLFADMKLSELSRETPHYPLPIIKEIGTPGGGGNVVNNIAALKPLKLMPVSMIGNDWRGFMLEKYFIDNNIDTTHILKSDDFITNCYCKPMRMGISKVVYEDPRLDFENRKKINEKDEERIIKELDLVANETDIIAVSDQMKYGIITDKIRERISYWGQFKPVFVDSRDNASKYKNVIVKPNEVEAAILIGKDINGLNLSIDDYSNIASELHIKNNYPTIVTLGEIGSLWADDEGVKLASTIKADDPIDIVGAGDTFLSAITCAYAAGASGPEAIAYGNLASGVTVKKIGTTGTASREEILDKYREYYK